MIMRVLSYWLLNGSDGGKIARITLAPDRSRRAAHAIRRLRERFAEPFRVTELATAAHLSPSAFRRQFKSITCMAPLRYQKQLRLLEARWLMMSGMANAETAARTVGYESASRSSREYARAFGAAPRRDIVSSRQAT